MKKAPQDKKSREIVAKKSTTEIGLGEGTGRPWRVEPPDDPKLYKGINLDEPILEEIL